MEGLADSDEGDGTEGSGKGVDTPLLRGYSLLPARKYPVISFPLAS